MKKMLRAFLICLALLMCLTPVLVACDKAGDTDEDGTSAEARFITKHISTDKSAYVVMYQDEPTNGKTTVKCSLVCYNAADDSVIDSVTFDLKVNGEDVKFECFSRTTWWPDKAEVVIKDHDGKKTTYTLKTK